MDGVPTDDDLNYTLLGLMILEEYGLDFTTDQLGEAWIKYLPFAFTAEGIALDNLRKGVPPMQAAEVDNCFLNWIGADIRSDPWGYAAPGWPEKAAEFAYRDAYVSHRRNGIYAAMFFSAAISAASPLTARLKRWRSGWKKSRPIAPWRARPAGRWKSRRRSRITAMPPPPSKSATPSWAAPTPSITRCSRSGV